VSQVYGVDVGHGQVMGSIAQDPRVTVMERTNLRHLTPDALPEQVRTSVAHARPRIAGVSLVMAGSAGVRADTRLACALTPPPLARAQVSLVTLDLSFISVLKVMPALSRVLAPGGQVVVLIKPQFEAGRTQVGSGGLVKDPQVGGCVVAGGWRAVTES
jgi:23S rRNA (cytidine1920-2'-O)/16S rRNA (cytidine1409-2'-O)-methyltransferase